MQYLPLWQRYIYEYYPIKISSQGVGCYNAAVDLCLTLLPGSPGAQKIDYLTG
jgi:hypothetical protein